MCRLIKIKNNIGNEYFMTDTQIKSNQRPKMVILAVKFLIASIIWSIPIAIISYYDKIIQPPLFKYILKSTIGIIFSLILVYLIYIGKNWARILFIVSYFIIMVPAIIVCIALRILPEFHDCVYLFQVVLNTIAIVFLLKDESIVWFKQVKAKE